MYAQGGDTSIAVSQSRLCLVPLSGRMANRMANDLPPPPKLTAIAGGSGVAMARRTDQLSQVSIWRPLPIFRDARPACNAAAALDRPSFITSQYPPGCVPFIYGDEATTIRRWSTPLRGSNHQRRRLDTRAASSFGAREQINHFRSFRAQTMAAAYVTVTPALAELIRYAHHHGAPLCDTEADSHTSSLPQDEVPIKLRCAICSKLAVNAFRTPCCEQMICENCKYHATQTMSPNAR